MFNKLAWQAIAVAALLALSVWGAVFMSNNHKKQLETTYEQAIDSATAQFKAEALSELQKQAKADEARLEALRTAIKEENQEALKKILKIQAQNTKERQEILAKLATIEGANNTISPTMAEKYRDSKKKWGIDIHNAE